MIPAWHIQTEGQQYWDVMHMTWEYCPCSKHTDDVKAKNKLCQRFYVTAWTLGLSFGAAATIYSLSEHNNNRSSRFCLWISIVGSFLTGLTHFYVISKKRSCTRRNWILYRFILSLIGIVVVICFTVAGALVVDDAHGMFVMLAFLSVGCYFLVSVALSKRLYWECSRDFADENRTGRRHTGRLSTTNDDGVDNLFFVCYGHDGQLEMVRTRQHGGRFINSNNSNSDPIGNIDNRWSTPSTGLPVLSIPSYDDVISEPEHRMSCQPPKYTEHDVTTATETHIQTHPYDQNTFSDVDLSVNQHRASDQPPQYTEHAH